MATVVILPKLDEAMRTGKIVKWMKKEGDWVEKGEIIVVIETEKVTFEIEAEESGILSKVMANEGDEVLVGTPIACILRPGEEAPEIPELVILTKREAQLEMPKVPEAEAIKASPVAKKLAQEYNIDIATIKGTGPGGRILREDVMRAVEERKTKVAQIIREEPRAAEEEMIPLSSMRKVIARRMTESFQTPHIYLTVEVDTQELEKTRTQLIPLIESKLGVKLTISDLIIKIVAKALEDNPSMNCAYVDGFVKLFKRIDIGLVTAVEGGLYVPVIREANKKSLVEIVRDRAMLVQKARDHKLTMDEMRGSTFTISNLGMFGIDQFSAILQPPEAAILAVGCIKDKAVVREGQIVVRPVMTLTLSIDHRVLDGVIGAQFLQSVKNYVENPVTVFL